MTQDEQNCSMCGKVIECEGLCPDCQHEQRIAYEQAIRQAEYHGEMMRDAFGERWS